MLQVLGVSSIRCVYCVIISRSGSFCYSISSSWTQYSQKAITCVFVQLRLLRDFMANKNNCWEREITEVTLRRLFVPLPFTRPALALALSPQLGLEQNFISQSYYFIFMTLLDVIKRANKIKSACWLSQESLKKLINIKVLLQIVFNLIAKLSSNISLCSSVSFVYSNYYSRLFFSLISCTDRRLVLVLNINTNTFSLHWSS